MYPYPCVVAYLAYIVTDMGLHAGSRRLLTYSRKKGDPIIEQAASRSAEIAEPEKKKVTADELNTFRKKVSFRSPYS